MGFKPHTHILLITDKVGNMVTNHEKVLQSWSEYYEKHFQLQDRTDNHSGEEWTMWVQTAEPYAAVGTYLSISTLKNGKATGHGQILPELIKEGGKELKVIYKFIFKILEGEIIP